MSKNYGINDAIKAENWIAHIEKIFEVLGCDDQFKEWLATYKLEGDAHSWWRAYKQAKGGDAYVKTLSWNDFRAIFFLQYFPRSEQEKYKREYKSIRQLDGETTIAFMTRFVRLAGFLGAKAGTPEEQAKSFKWALNDIARDKLVNIEFTDVAEVANAARNIEILQKEMLASTLDDNKIRTRESEKDENEAYSGKQRDNHRNEWRQNTQHGNGRDQSRYPRGSNAAYSDSAPITKCNTCGKRHPSNTCYKATGACYNCRQIGHKAIDCKGKDSTSSKGNDENNSPTTTRGRVFAMTSTQFAKP
ncbi:zinc finger, CCHC-type, retrotransposon gag domain protein [Tanacetum coccineum]